VAAGRHLVGLGAVGPRPIGGALMVLGLATRWVAVMLVVGSVVAPMIEYRP